MRFVRERFGLGTQTGGASRRMSKYANVAGCGWLQKRKLTQKMRLVHYAVYAERAADAKPVVSLSLTHSVNTDA